MALRCVVAVWLAVDADLSWSSARFTDEDSIGSQIPGAVRQVASAGVPVSELGRWSGQLRLRYLGPRPIMGGVHNHPVSPRTVRVSLRFDF